MLTASWLKPIQPIKSLITTSKIVPWGRGGHVENVLQQKQDSSHRCLQRTYKPSCHTANRKYTIFSLRKNTWQRSTIPLCAVSNNQKRWTRQGNVYKNIVEHLPRTPMTRVSPSPVQRRAHHRHKCQSTSTAPPTHTSPTVAKSRNKTWPMVDTEKAWLHQSWH